MAYEGTPDEVAANFVECGMDNLGYVLLEESKNKERDLQQALYCFDQAEEAQPTDNEIKFEMLTGRAKANMFRAQYGHVKTDCLAAIKINPKHEQTWFILGRCRFFLGQWEAAVEYLNQGLKELP